MSTSNETMEDSLQKCCSLVFFQRVKQTGRSLRIFCKWGRCPRMKRLQKTCSQVDHLHCPPENMLQSGPFALDSPLLFHHLCHTMLSSPQSKSLLCHDNCQKLFSDQPTYFQDETKVGHENLQLDRRMAESLS